ncbi:hypothetical protein [uncultured Alistipes sp.]|nr:hypothetical protein [uncultured Alistipes sp.]
MKKRYDLLNVREDDPQASLDSGPSVHGVVRKGVITHTEAGDSFFEKRS